MKAVLVMDMPDSCLNCPMINSSDECILQDEDANFIADNWEMLRDGCPLKPLPEKRPPKKFSVSPLIKECHSEYSRGWNSCLEAIGGNEE